MVCVNERLFVLRVIRHGESDLILHALSSKGAKLGLFARGALRSRKRFGGGVLEPTHYIEATYQPPRLRGNELTLGVLKEAKLIESFEGIRRSYERLQLAFYILDVLNRISHDGMLDGLDMFNLLGNTFRGLEIAEDLEKLRTHFEIKVLNYQGILPASAGFQMFLRTSSQKTDQIDISQTLWQDVKRQAHQALQEYIAPR
jgi:DNA repair protein RecO (recombination protein O)